MNNVGRLRHLAHLLKYPDEVDEFGNQKNLEVDFRIKCNVQIISGTEILKNGIALTSEYISVLCHYNKNVKHNHIFVWEGNEYNIDMIRPDDKKTQMIITASREF